MDQPRAPGTSATALSVLAVGCVVLLILAAGGAVATPAAGDSTPSATDPAAVVDSVAIVEVGAQTAPDRATPARQVDADRTRIDVALEPDGASASDASGGSPEGSSGVDAVWTLELWTRLEDDAAREAFASLESDVENDSAAYADDFAGRMTGTIDAASESTGREMSLHNVTASTRTEAIPQDYGVLTYEFRWTGFAASDGQELRAGEAVDAFLLEPGTRLTVRWPAEYRATSITPEPDDRSETAATWRGESTDFVTGEPRLVLTSGEARDSVLPVALAALVLLAALAVAWWLVRTGRVALPGDAGAQQRPGDGADGGTPVGDEAGADTGDAAGAATLDDAPADGGADPGEAGTAAPGASREELLSNEERVLRVLERNGGRMKQQEVVAALDWTEAKTSQVVTSMDEEGLIEKFRIGRENVLALPEEADL